MAESQCNLFEPDFNRSIKVQTTDQRFTCNAGVILLPDAKHRIGLIDAIAQNRRDPRDPRRIRYPGKLGVLEEGVLADMVLINGDPLKNLKLFEEPEKHILVIMKDSKLFKNTVKP